MGGVVVPKRVNVSTAHPSPSRSSSGPTANMPMIDFAAAAWSESSISARSRSGVSGELGTIGTDRSMISISTTFPERQRIRPAPLSGGRCTADAVAAQPSTGR